MALAAETASLPFAPDRHHRILFQHLLSCSNPARLPPSPWTCHRQDLPEGSLRLRQSEKSIETGQTRLGGRLRAVEMTSTGEEGEEKDLSALVVVRRYDLRCQPVWTIEESP
jgi:hypothetical protein